MSEKKAFRRSVANALGVICTIVIVLIVSSYINAQETDLQFTLQLGKSTDWVNNQTISQTAGSYYQWTFPAKYAGYVLVTVQYSISGPTYVRVIYSAWYAEVNYDNQTSVVYSGETVGFPILPTPSVEIRVDDSNLINGATANVTITYYY